MVNPSRSLNTHLDQKLMVHLDLILFSEVEQRVPKGAYQKFFDERLRDFFNSQSLDLAPYLGALPGELTVRGTPRAIARLKETLERNGS